MTGGDPRSIVTPDAFQVATDLLGTPLAAPWLRLVALLIDLVLIGMLQLLGWGVLGGVAAVIGLRLAMRRSGAPMGPVGRGALGCVSAFVFLIAMGVTLFTADQVRDSLSRSGASDVVGDAASIDGGPTLGDLVGGVSGFVALAAATDEDEAVAAATDLAASMRETGSPRSEIHSAIEDLVDESTDFDGEAVADAALAAVFGDEPEGDPMPLPDEAIDTVQALTAAVEELTDALDESEEQRRIAETALEGAEAEGSSTLFAWIRDAADEAGLIFGWGTVYLTLFLVLWDGRTPGKKVLGLRVVRLNGEPLSLFLSLERAGGYAAGLATGLLGFAQVMWDPNRQAIHDKIAETVVIRENVPKPHWASGRRFEALAETTKDSPAK